MRLTTDEYRRGVVKWRINGDATVVLESGQGEEAVTSAPMSDPMGSIPDIVPVNGGNISLRPASPDMFAGPVHIGWDRLVGDEIETRVWDSLQGEFHLVGIPALGPYQRLVVSTPYLQWEDGSVVRTGDVMVRFTDHVVLERQQPTAVEQGNLQSSFTFEVSTQRLTGSFVEIIAPENLGREREIVFVVLALLALVVGDAAVGDAVQLDSLVSTPVGTEYTVRFPQHSISSAANRTLRMRRPITIQDIDLFDRMLVHLLNDDVLRADTMLSLRWYERALRTAEGVDKFLAAFVGLEALVTRRSKRLSFVSPINALLIDPNVPELLAPLRAKYPDDQVDRLLKRLRDTSPSLIDRSSRLADQLGLGEEWKATFRKASEVRNPLVHGGRGAIDESLPSETTKLLATVLKVVLE